MKLLSTFQIAEDVASKIEQVTRDKNIPEDKLTIVTKEEQKETVENLVNVNVDGLSKEDIRYGTSTDKYKLDESDDTLFMDTIKRGGFVILQEMPKSRANEDELNHHKDKEPAREDKSEKGDFESALDDHLSAPGFGVDFKEPGTNAQTHEDNFNPDNHSENPETN